MDYGRINLSEPCISYQQARQKGPKEKEKGCNGKGKASKYLFLQFT